MVFSQALLTREAKVAIEGEIENSGKYAWKEGLRVADLVKDAGGLKPGAGKTAKIERNTIENGKLKQKTLIVNLEKALGRDLRYNLRLQPFDLLVCMKQ
jgi:protein involved in polysaccharide export with SLBB domain